MSLESRFANGTGSGDGDARHLLRKLRDLNLRASLRGTPGGSELRIEGCLSVDRPVEDSVRYLVRVDGQPLELDIQLRDGSIELAFEGETLSTRHPLARGDEGRIRIEGVGELSAHENRPEEIERFLLELVRQASRRHAG